jgi:hypothetical protein
MRPRPQTNPLSLFQRIFSVLPALLLMLPAAAATAVSDSGRDANIQLSGGSIRVDVGGTLRFPDQVVSGDPIQLTTAAGPLRVAVNDARGSGTGWRLTLQSTDFINDSSDHLPVDGFTYFNPDANPLQQLDWPGTPPTAQRYNHPVALSNPILILEAGPGEGMGDGGATLERRLFALRIPANVRAGFYRATLTATVIYTPESE